MALRFFEIILDVFPGPLCSTGSGDSGTRDNAVKSSSLLHPSSVPGTLDMFTYVVSFPLFGNPVRKVTFLPFICRSRS